MTPGHDWHGVGRSLVRLHWPDGDSVRAGDPVPADLAECQRCGLLVAHVEQRDGERWQRATGHGVDVESLVIGRAPRCAPLRAEVAA